MNGNYFAIVQGRMGSTRLPGKVLMSILEKPMLGYLIERLGQSKTLAGYIMATTVEDADTPIAQFCEDQHILHMRGSEDDVLERFYMAALQCKADHIVRITADCPIIDPQVIDKVVQEHQKSGDDYTTNAIDSTYPDGMDVEVFTFKALERAYKEAKLTSEREHVTPYLHTNPDLFQLGYVRGEEDHSHLRLTVDHEEDFTLVKAIIEALYPKNPTFGLPDILDLLTQKPELVKINAKYTRNEGYEQSKREDKAVG